jgi:hypothetical protein
MACRMGGFQLHVPHVFKSTDSVLWLLYLDQQCQATLVFIIRL